MSQPVIGPKGERMAFNGSPEDWAAAQQQGWRLDDGSGPTTLESLKGAAAEVAPIHTAAGLGILQGVTAGGYGAYVGATQPHETKAAVLKAMEESPVATGIGELAGMVVSPLNKIAPAVEGERAATVLGRIGQKVVGGMPVGALYGAGNVVSDAALGDTQLTAEKLVAGGGLGMLLGGLGGGVGGVIEEGAAKLLPKLATVIKGSQSALDEVADHAALKSFRNTAKELQKYAEKDIEAAVNVTRDRGHLALSPESMGKSIADDVAKVGSSKGAFLDAADTAAAKPDWAGALKNIDDHFAALSPTEQSTAKGAYAEARATLEELGTRPKGAGWRDFDKWKQDVQSKAKFLGVSTDDSLISKLKRNLAGFAREEVDRQLVPALGADGAKFLEAKATYGALKTAERMAHTGAGRGTGFSLVDIAASLGLGSAHPFGLVGGLGVKFIREHGAAVVAQVADRLAKSPALQAVAHSFAAALPTTVPQLGRYGPALMLAAERSPAMALAQHIVTAQVDPEYAANAQMAGLTPESPVEHAAALGKATSIAAVHAAMKAHEKDIDDGIKHIVDGTKPAKASPVLKTQDFGAKQQRRDSQAAHANIVQRIRELASNPSALVDVVASNTESFGAAAPGVSAHMTSVADRAVKYLATQAEVPPKPGPMAREWVPNETERHSFALKLEAVQEPMSILRHAANGTLTKLQIQAVGAVYPQFLRQIQDKALEQMASGEAMPYRARMSLSLLTGIDADGTMSPKAIAANQAAIAAANKPNPPPEGPSDGASTLDIAGRASTKSQKSELEMENA